MTTIGQYKHYQYTPPINVQLPDSLSPQEFARLLTSSWNPKAAFTFPALDKWLSKLVHNLDHQRHEAHPFYRHPYKLWTLDIQAVDWFWRGVHGREDKLVFMKIQSKIETESYVHDR